MAVTTAVRPHETHRCLPIIRIVILTKRARPIEKPRKGKRRKVIKIMINTWRPSFVRGFKNVPILSCFLRTLIITKMAQPIRTTPNHRGKNPGPGPYSE
jgi:hypothetical protein